MSTEVAKITNSYSLRQKKHSGSDHEQELNQATDLDRVRIKVPRFQTFLKRSAFHLKVELLASSSFSMGSFLRGRTNGLGEMISTCLEPTHFKRYLKPFHVKKFRRKRLKLLLVALFQNPIILL